MYYSHILQTLLLYVLLNYSISSKKEEFDKRNVELIGYSVDGIQSHIAWALNIKEKFNVDIEFPIVAAPSIAYDYWMLQPSADSSHTVRAVFIINPEWKISALMYYPLSNGRNIDEIIRLIDSLQMSANNGRATPANWPNNDIFGSDVIVPPASTLAEAVSNPAKYENKDWYICTEKCLNNKKKIIHLLFLFPQFHLKLILNILNYIMIIL